ncbi:MAG TPA: DNA translocase FtsK [Opitutaceae bacterium]|nr:DNA translocase FtsK [Opitutaceae bacterium]
MAKSASSNSNPAPAFKAPRYQPHWAVASSCLLFGLLLAVAFFDYSPEQSKWHGTQRIGRNLVGHFGADFAWLSLHWIGISIWLLPVFLLWMAYVSVRNARRLPATRIVAMLICILSFSALAAMIDGFGEVAKFSDKSQYFTNSLGGVVGDLIYGRILEDSLGVFGSGLLLSMVYVIGLAFIFTRDIGLEFQKFAEAVHEWREQRAKLAAERAEMRREMKAARLRQKNAGAPLPVGPPQGKKLALTRNTTPPIPTPTAEAMANAEEREKEIAAQESIKAAVAKAIPPPPSPAPKPVRAPKTGKTAAENAPLATDAKELAANAAGRFELNIVKPEELKKAAKATLPQSSDEKYLFPPLTLLREQAKTPFGNSEEEHRRNAENLLRILSEFGVDVSLGEIHVGPVITRYEVIPAAGVRVEKIAGLDKNIALGMRAQSVRILAPIPGKAAVGVEVPNQHPTPVGMREILESEDWAGVKSELPIALGKDVSGKPLVSDLSKMPHLLIAGATGSGKSVCINSIVASILYSKSPKDVRLLMVDPKIVELKIFNTLPHMLIPVVTEPKKVPAALKWLLREMEQRYQMFAKVGVRNIIGFNGRKKGAAPEIPPENQAVLEGVDPTTLEEVELPEKLPYIVAIIDELADLMMVAPAEIETSIARLAQLARAAGIHLIIATQRPSVNVITGVIKANLPSRIAFQVASQVDSRTILDTKGADTLIGRGDMLFSPPGSSRLVRAQGAFVSDEEVHELVEFLKKNGPPQYAQEVQAQIDHDPDAEDEEGGEEDTDLGDDEQLLKQAIGVLKSTRRASTSMLQRRLRIGYNRAARLMELMEDKGIVGPENGAQPREILQDLDQL